MNDAGLLHELLDERARTTPDGRAVTAGESTLTHGELREASLRLAGWLDAVGVRRGDRVALRLPASAPTTAVLYAVSRLGAAFCVLHEQVRGPALEHVLRDLEPAVLLTDDPDAPAEVAVYGSAEIGRAAAEYAPIVETPAVATTDTVCLIYTSGSTSLPKAVVTEHRQLLFAARAIQSEIRYAPGDTVFVPLPLAFDYGLYQLFLGAISGAHICLGAPAEGGVALLRGLERARATVLAATPPIAETLVWLLGRARSIPGTLRLLTTTGAAMPAHTARALRAALPALRLQIMYGLTECKRVAIMPPDEDLRRPGASGRPLAGTEVVVLDPGDIELPPGEIGEFVVRGPHVMAGYWRRAEQTERCFGDTTDGRRFLRTGDFGWLDADGYLYLDGRRDDVYKERGHRVSVLEIEAAVREVPEVRSAAVVPPGPDTHAVLVVSGPVIAAEVLTRLRALIEPYKVPRRCVVIETMPLTGNGKVDRAAVAELIGAVRITS
ncbi:class I adenylate-forming enzyme family protein [Nocardia pseudobrasiliensis]|uniref:Acyl-CoA synthetase (AMP-forming)/AMP-acid ligase II n=1 Tax=Nocardia pseudobrasiliensis TaxID=45979 RepID=A0A370I9L9_9NOCA|nr:class I adenylate-forming enzyme family protein [Nocardia pseudobrasiliensis]RDI67403.1 acyl-CoA synthetase (AMP-forming)/AMP-acid ligase II [Nocardia pseudobrasiliensis]